MRQRLPLLVAGVSLAFLGWAEPAGAQRYQLRLDLRGQSVAYRGLAKDSIAVGDVVIGSFGGPQTPDGFAVTCVTGAEFCSYFRPGPDLEGQVLTTTVDLAVWGLRVPGLSVRARGRLGLDLGEADVWPGTNPALQLYEAYAEYATRSLTARAGRQFVTSRLGWTGFDGARVTVRAAGQALDFEGYAGWSLARSAAVPITSPSLNPLDEYQPRQRHLVAGAAAGWAWRPLSLRGRYEREVDAEIDKFVSERLAADATVRGPAGLSVNAGADYDLAAGFWGNAEASLGYARGVVAARVGGRQYRPFFPLWTIWGAFSPVPYDAGFASVQLGPFRNLSLRASGETYAFDDAEADTPLVPDETTSGWRWSVAAAYVTRAWGVDLGYHREFGPGAASDGLEGTVRYAPNPRLTLAARAGNLFRPLEFRFSDSDLWLAGFDAEYRASERIRATAGVGYYDEARERPDAAAFSWNQLRLTAGVSLLFGTPADRGTLPEVLRRMPEGEGGPR